MQMLCLGTLPQEPLLYSNERPSLLEPRSLLASVEKLLQSAAYIA